MFVEEILNGTRQFLRDLVNSYHDKRKKDLE